MDNEQQTNVNILSVQSNDCQSFEQTLFTSYDQGFGGEKDGNHDKFIDSNLAIFCYREFEKFALCKSITHS